MENINKLYEKMMYHKLIKLIPPIYRADLVKCICEPIQYELDRYFEELNLADLQKSPRTATYALDRWSELTDTDISNMSESEAQYQILMKMKGFKQITVQTIKSIVESNANAQCIVTEEFNKYHIIIEMKDKYGVPDNLDLIKRMLKDIIPAHLTFDIEIKFRTWGSITKLNNNYDFYKEKKLSWNDLKIYNI